jgi:hypothetical protein
VSAQRRLNCYFENRIDGDKTKVAVYGTPGMVLQFSLPTLIRGMLGTQSSLYAVAGNTFYSLSSTGSTLYSKTISTGSGTVVMAGSASQMLFVDGSGAYLWDGTACNPLVAAGFPYGAKTITFCSGYFVSEQPGSQKFWVSNVYDGSQWSALSFASAAQYSDNILAVDSLIGNLVLFSERHIEFWQNVGTSPEPFAPLLSATSEYGLAAIYSRAHIASTIIYVAENPQGTAQVCQINGYQVTPISTPDLEYTMAQFSTVSDAVAMSYVIDGHPMYQVTFPTADRSFLYDVSTGIWSEVQTGVTANYATRHIGNFSTYYAGNILISDYKNGNVYRPVTDVYTDNGATVLREIVTRHGSIDFNTFTIDEMYLDMSTGVGLNTGQGSAPLITLEVSKDNGRTYSTPRQLQVGPLGNYRQRVIARRFGSARDFVFRFRMSDPVKFVITEGAVTVRKGDQ